MGADLPPPGRLPREDQPPSLGPGSPPPGLSFAYYRYMAWVHGVPELWLADAAQDIAVPCWRRGNTNPGTIRSAAIDAARRYGPRNRYGDLRPVTVPLETVHGLSLPETAPSLGHRIEGLDLAQQIKRAARKLTLKQRMALSRRIRGLPMSVLDSTHTWAARKRLREELCA